MKIVLPYRTGELLELLARIDLLCDQLDDCLVKLDSILGILVVHPSNPQAFTAMNKKLEVFFSVESASTMKETDQTAFQIFADADNSEEENIRSCASSSEYDLKSVRFDTRLIVVGPEDRISHLACPKAPPSPSLRYREEVSVVKFEPCPHGENKCSVCSSPAVHQLRMSAAVLYAYIYAHKGNFRPARENLRMVRNNFFLISCFEIYFFREKERDGIIKFC